MNALAIHYLTKKEYEDSGDKWNKNYFIIPNGIDKHEQNVYNDTIPRRWSYIARYEIYQKGIDLLIKAMGDNVEELIRHNVVLNMYGEGPRDVVDAIKKQIQQYGLNDVIKVNGAAYDDEKEKVLRNTDLFVLTSRFEGHPMGLIEALSYGIPCLITEGSNMKDEVENAGAGWTCENDSESISNAIRMILNNRVPLSEFSNHAAELSSRYVWDSLAKEAHAKYAELIQQKKNL